MSHDSKSFHRYLLADSLDRDWGIYATSAGYVSMAPGLPYPPPGHPKTHAFKWEDGRRLDEVQIHFITKGGGTFESVERDRPAQRIATGSVFLLFPGVWHRFGPDLKTGWFEYWIGLKGSYLDQLLERKLFTPAQPVFTPPDSEPMLRLFTEAVACLRHHPAGTSRMLGSIAGLILAELQTGTVAVPPAENRTAHLVQEAKLMLGQHLEEDVDLEAMARKLGAGYHWLRRTFKQETGQSLHQYRLQNRLSRAKVLLRSSDATVEQIAQQTGFTDPYYFSEIFKRKTGCSPTSWRKSELPHIPI